MSNFYTDTIRNDAAFASPTRVARLGLLEPVTRAAVQAIIADALVAGIDLRAFETYRSRQRQAALHAQGASQLKQVGVHHYGLAADLVKVVGGSPSWKGDFAFLGKLARRHGLIWGGDWGKPGVKPKFVDGVHVQRIKVAHQKKLFAGDWYPDDAYDPWA